MNGSEEFIYNVGGNRIMFTRFAKGFLWFLSIAVVIASIAVASILDDILWFFIILVGGFVTLMFFGMFVELCNNILDIKHYLLRGGFSNSNTSSYNNYSVPASNNSYNAYSSNVYDNNFGNMLSQAAKVADVEKKAESQEGWFCRQCGTKNKMHATFCSGCGKTK